MSHPSPALRDPAAITPLLRPPWFAVGVGTLGLGATVAASWLLLGGTVAFRGPMRVLEESGVVIYAGQGLLAAGGAFVSQHLAGGISLPRFVGIVVAAWIGELVVLLVGGTIFANELVPQVAWFYWLVGTGGPIQPLAAVIGGWLGLRR